jgi:hypothetical protein
MVAAMAVVVLVVLLAAQVDIHLLEVLEVATCQLEVPQLMAGVVVEVDTDIGVLAVFMFMLPLVAVAVAFVYLVLVLVEQAVPQQQTLMSVVLVAKVEAVVQAVVVLRVQNIVVVMVGLTEVEEHMVMVVELTAVMREVQFVSFGLGTLVHSHQLT